MRIFILTLLFSQISFARPIQKVEYVRTIDGDTIEVNIPGVYPVLGHKIKVRIAGIDTPELRTQNECEKRLAYQAKDYVEKFLDGARWINLGNVKRGKYFRLVADVYKVKIGKIRRLGAELLEEGLAVPYNERKDDIDWCKFESDRLSQ